MIAISIVMIILSIATGIGVYIYIKKQDNSSITDMNSKNIKTEIPSKTINIAKESLSIDKLEKNIITILKIKNSDFNMLSESGQSVVEDVLRQLALSLQYDIQFYITSRVIDNTKPIEKTQRVLKMTENPHIRQYALNYIKEFNLITENERLAQREDYIILTYVGDMKVSQRELDRRASQFITALQKISTKCEVLSTDKIIDLIYHDLNRNDYFSPSSAIKLGSLSLYLGTQAN